MGDQKTPKRRVGRPRKEPRARSQKRFSLGFKVSSDLKRQLGKAADITGRTQSAEAEARLENSFRAEQALDEALVLAYGREGAGLALLVAEVMRTIGWRSYILGSTAKSMPVAQEWMDDPFAYRCVVESVTFVLNALRPDGDASMPAGHSVKDVYPNESPQVLEQRALEMATGAADQMLRFISDAGRQHARDVGPQDDFVDQYELMRRKLGRLAARVRSTKPSVYDIAAELKAEEDRENEQA
jgi:predicted transcriptional regulator